MAEKKLAMRVKTVSEQVARDRIAGRKTDDLIRDFIMTNMLFDPHIPTVRGWIMDELEKRNPEAFEAWLMQDDPDDRQLPAFFRWRTRRNSNGEWFIYRGHSDEPGRKVLPDRDAAVAEIMWLAVK